MAHIFEAVTAFFREDEWHFEQHDNESALYVNFQGANGQWRCYAETRESPPQFVFYSLCPVNAPEAKHHAISEFLSRANFGLVIGNFEFDFEDGEIRYKTSIDVEGSRLDSALIERLVYSNVVMMDQYLPGIMKVIYGDISPQKAIAQIEGEPE